MLPLPETYICPNCQVATNGARQTKRLTDIANLPSPARSVSAEAPVEEKVGKGKGKTPAKRGRKKGTTGVAAEEEDQPTVKRKTKAGAKQADAEDEEEVDVNSDAMAIDHQANVEEPEEEKQFKSDPESNDEASDSDSGAEGSNYGDEPQDKAMGSQRKGRRANGKPELDEESESQSGNEEVGSLPSPVYE